MKLWTMGVGFFLIAQISFSQNLDSLVLASKPGFLPGKIPTYYTPGKKSIALKLQALSTSLAEYYEKQYDSVFQVKLAVLDSAHWPNDLAPYGIIFYRKGWAFMHAGMSFESFQNLYGMQGFEKITKTKLKRNHMRGSQMVQSFLEFYTAHELGHYYFNVLSGARYPDYFTNEWIASYFAFQYLKENKPRTLPAFDLFCQLYKDNIKPKFTSVQEFNQHYLGDAGGIPTYGWYQVNFYFLCKSLWNCADRSLIPRYKMAFKKGATEKLSPEAIVKTLGVCEQDLSGFEKALDQ